MRWDNVFTGYILAIFVTELEIGSSLTSQDVLYTKMFFMMGFIHFAFETSQSWYFIYSNKTALSLSIVTVTICVVEAILIWVIPDTMVPIFKFQFLFSDAISCLSSLCMMFNKAMPQKMRLYALAVCLHYIGVTDLLYQIPNHLFVSSHYDGAGWVMLGLFSLPQLFLCQNVVRGELNHIGPVIYDESKNSKFFILFSKYGTVLIAALVLPGIRITMEFFRTTEAPDTNPSDAQIDGPFAVWIWDDVISVLFWPMAMFGIFWTLYLRATPHIPESEKKQ